MERGKKNRFLLAFIKICACYIEERECDGRGGMTWVREIWRGEKMTAPCMACHWPVSLLIEPFFSLSFLTAFSFVCASQTRHYPSAICSFSPPLLVCDWFDAIWKGLQSGGSLVPFLSRMVASIQLPPSLSFSLSPCVSCVSCFSLCIHMDSSSVSSLLYLSPLRLYAGKAWVPLTSRFPPHTDSLEHFGFGNLGLSI